MTRRYAEGTTVGSEKSLAEIRGLLARAGATHFAFGEEPERGIVQFALAGRHYRFTIQKPKAKELEVEYERTRRPGMRASYLIDFDGRVDAEWRRRWRARLLWLKAMLEFAEHEPGAFAEAMMANTVLPDGRTLGSIAAPQIDAAYESGRMPALLGDGR